MSTKSKIGIIVIIIFVICSSFVVAYSLSLQNSDTQQPQPTASPTSNPTPRPTESYSIWDVWFPDEDKIYVDRNISFADIGNSTFIRDRNYESITFRNETYINKTIAHVSYVDGVVIFKQWDEHEDVGIVVVVAKEDIKNNNTNPNPVFIFSDSRKLMDSVNNGTILMVPYGEIHWDWSKVDGKRFYYIDDPKFIVTGHMSVNDPDFSKYLDAIIDDIQDARFASMMAVIIAASTAAMISSTSASMGY